MILLQDNIVKIPKLQQENREKRANTVNNNSIESILAFREISNNDQINKLSKHRLYNESLPDPIQHLTQEWWHEVNTIEKQYRNWKKIYIAVQTLITYSRGNLLYVPYEDHINDAIYHSKANLVQLPKKIKDNKESKKILELFVEWMVVSIHIPTQ
eukprot:269252_1